MSSQNNFFCDYEYEEKMKAYKLAYKDRKLKERKKEQESKKRTQNIMREELIKRQIQLINAKQKNKKRRLKEKSCSRKVEVNDVSDILQTSHSDNNSIPYGTIPYGLRGARYPLSSQGLAGDKIKRKASPKRKNRK